MTAYQRRQAAWRNPGAATRQDYAARNCIDAGHRWPPKGFR